jgi:hypothetical protein
MKLQSILVYGYLVLAASMPLSAGQVHRPAKHEQVAPPGPNIRVLLEKDATSAFLEAKGPYRVVRRDSGSRLSSGSVGKRFVVHAIQDGLRWGEEYPDVYQICVIPLSKDTSILVNGIQYKGAVSVYHVRDNHITVVNEVPIEEYLKSTLTVQYDESLSKEAMAALAIAARTEAYNKALQGTTSPRPWDIATHEASYYGFGVTQRKNGIEEAIDWTRYMVLKSVKTNEPAQNVRLVPDKADELAKKGCDAQKILQTLFPQTKIGATIHPDEVAVR